MNSYNGENVKIKQNVRQKNLTCFDRHLTLMVRIGNIAERQRLTTLFMSAFS